MKNKRKELQQNCWQRFSDQTLCLKSQKTNLQKIFAAVFFAAVALVSLTVTASAQEYSWDDLHEKDVLDPGDVINSDKPLYIIDAYKWDYICLGDNSFTIPDTYSKWWIQEIRNEYEEDYDEETGELNWIIDDNWVYINPYYVESVELSKYELTLKEGTSTQIEASTQPSDGVDPCAYDPSIIWASGDPSVATVDGGKITAVAPGTATITATATNGTDDTADDKTATCTVTVKEVKIADTYKEINSTTGWCLNKSGNAVYLIYRLSASEEDLKKYDFISILNSKNETIFPDEKIAEGEDGFNGKFNTVYTAIQFPDNSEISAGKNEYLIAFELSGITSQPKNFTITTGVNEE